MPPSSPDEHISPETLTAFAIGSLNTDESHQVSKHLAYCSRCRIAFIETMATTAIPEDHAPIDPIPLSTSSYHRFERIAYGGMGVVYSAFNKKTGEKVAIKRILRSNTDGHGSDRKERLARESHTLLKLNHPNIIRAIELIFLDDAPALVMEYIQGQSLHRWARQEHPDVRLCANVVITLSQAISYSHSQGVFHCDMKPQNVLVTQDPSGWGFKLIDFGLAKLSDEDWHITQSGDVLGTPAYLAPEQTLRNAIRATPSIDIYGLGTILYELLVGRPPFDASSSKMLLAKVANEPPARPRKLRPEIPVSIERICLKCLHKQPEDRYESALALADDLRAFLANEPISAKELNFVKQLTRRVQSNRMVTSFLVAACILTIVSGIWIWREALTFSKLQASIKRVETENEIFQSRARQAEQAALEELRHSFEDVSDRLFGSTPDKEDREWEQLERMSQRWRQFAEQLVDLEARKLIRAEALMRIGSVQSVFGNAGTAQEQLKSALTALPKKLDDTYEESRRLAIESETMWQLARCSFESKGTNEADKLFKDALTSVERAIQLQPNDARLPLIESKILRDYGAMLIQVSRYEQAHEHLDKSNRLMKALMETLSPKSDSPAEIRLRTNTLTQLAGSMIATARLTRSRGMPTQAIEFLDPIQNGLSELRTRLPDDPMTYSLLFQREFELGFCQLDLGDLEASKRSFLVALMHQKELLELYPRRQDLLKNCCSVYGSLTVVSIRLNQPEEALSQISESLSISSDLTAKYPYNLEYTVENAKSLSNIIAILASNNRFFEANFYCTEAIQVQSKLCREYPERADYKYGLAASLNIVATVQGKLEDTQQAYACFDQSIEIYTELIEQHPATNAYHLGLMKTLYSSANLALTCRDWKKAFEIYTVMIHSINSRKPSLLQIESSLLAKAYLGQAVTLKAMGQLAESRECATLGAATIAPWIRIDPLGSELYRHCTELTE